jgi:hypothetical protein
MGIWRSAGRGPPSASSIATSDGSGRTRFRRWETDRSSLSPTVSRTQPAPVTPLAGSRDDLISTLPESRQDARSHVVSFEGTTAWTVPPSGGTP